MPSASLRLTSKPWSCLVLVSISIIFASPHDKHFGVRCPLLYLNRCRDHCYFKEICLVGIRKFGVGAQPSLQLALRVVVPVGPAEQHGIVVPGGGITGPEP